MEFKGTKGKWEYLMQDWYDVSVVCAEIEICDFMFSEIEIEEKEANAKLIAAAPEMFEMLKELLELKQLKFNDGEYPSKEYRIRKPIAWENAKQLLTKITQ